MLKYRNYIFFFPKRKKEKKAARQKYKGTPVNLAIFAYDCYVFIYDGIL